MFVYDQIVQIINYHIQKYMMRGAIVGLSIILLLFPLSDGFSQDANVDLDVFLHTDTQYIYKDTEGYTVVVGTVENSNQLSAVNNVFIHVSFYDESGQSPLEYGIGHATMLDVIPPGGTSPFVIRSETPNPDIAEASVRVLSFDLSDKKQDQITLAPISVSHDNLFKISGTIQNGPASTADNKVHLAFYDAFDPPRILSTSTVHLGALESDTQTIFDFEGIIDTKAVGVLMFAESDVFYSEAIDVKIPRQQILTKLVTIHDVTATDEDGSKVSDIAVGSPVTISSLLTLVNIEEQEDDNATTPYKYYIQIKESGASPAVVFLDVYNGEFKDAIQSPTVVWTPEEAGLFVIETYVWDENNIPIANNGPIALFVVV